jgi:nucleoside-diphosphate-sugar epimerase
MNILVTGAGGFIGGHLVKRLMDEGHEVRAVDIKSREEWWQLYDRSENLRGDLSVPWQADVACKGQDWVFNLACDMGGIEYIEGNKAACMDSVLINAHMLRAARKYNVKRYLFTSSACVYRANMQERPIGPCTTLPPLKEADAYPAQAEDGYGWEKLFSERHCRHYAEDYGLDCRVVRLHNVYGPHGSWCDGREKAPAAICRKVAEAKRDRENHITIYGDGSRQRTFMWIEDCLEGLLRIMRSEICVPINLGIQHEVVTINQLVAMVQEVAGIDLELRHDLTKAQGVWGRASDNTFIRDELFWEPTTPLLEGLGETYPWIEKQVLSNADVQPHSDCRRDP